MTLWLAGWVPSIVFNRELRWRGGPEFYAIWIILAPLFLACASMAVYGLMLFYQWALARPSKEDRQERIERLERELGIGQ